MKTPITSSISLIVLLATALPAAAAEMSDSTSLVANRYATLLNSTARAIRTAPRNETLTNPYFFPLFASNTLLQFPLHNTIGSFSPRSERRDQVLAHLVPQLSTTLAEAYIQYPSVIRYNLSPVVTSTAPADADAEPSASGASPHETKETPAAPATPVIQGQPEQVKTSDEILDLSDFHIQVRRPNFWTVRGNFSTQFMQYYVSDNWYKGGENHISMLGIFNIEANYDNKQKITFTNKLETKLGFQSSPNDEFHKFKTNTDLLRLTNKLGIQAHKRWYYSAMLQSWTQFYKSYDKDQVRSDCMSPFESVLSLGLDYKLSKKRVNLTINIAPAAIDFKYCHRADIVTRYGIEAGRHSKWDFGATLTANMTLKFCDQVNWVTRFYTFYDYKDHLKSEWENTINVKVNKYLSTKLFLYPRFDNGVTKKQPTDSYFQFHEYLSVGLDLNF